MTDSIEITALRTVRFELRPLHVKDKLFFCNLYQDEELTQHIGGSLSDKRAATAFQASLKLNQKPFTRYTWTILTNRTTKIGVCAIVLNEVLMNTADIGIVILKKYHGTKVATEVLQRLIIFGFDGLKLDAISGYSLFSNQISFKLMTNLGFRYQTQSLGSLPGFYWHLAEKDYCQIQASYGTNG